MIARRPRNQFQHQPSAKSVRSSADGYALKRLGMNNWDVREVVDWKDVVMLRRYTEAVASELAQPAHVRLIRLIDCRRLKSEYTAIFRICRN